MVVMCPAKGHKGVCAQDPECGSRLYGHDGDSSAHAAYNLLPGTWFCTMRAYNLLLGTRLCTRARLQPSVGHTVLYSCELTPFCRAHSILLYYEVYLWAVEVTNSRSGYQRELIIIAFITILNQG